jgi:membrane-bound lytic murein transglycosylase B
MPTIRTLLRLRPSRKVTIGLALAGVLSVVALPISMVAAGQPDRRLQPVRAAYSAQATAAPAAPADAVNTDGSTLTAKLAHDADLRQTLLSLTEQAAGSKSAAGKEGTPAVVVGGSVTDIPAVALAAYRHAAQQQSVVDPSCHVSWSLLAGIGRVESSHGQYEGSRPDANGVVHPAILGPVLDGSGGNSAIPDTDGGQYDNDTEWDRAVGPMQFIPSSWATGGRDGNGDGIRDPENLFDAALAAANYLCRSGGDLRVTSAAERAVLTYNHSWDYVLVVLGYAASYANQDLSAVTADVAEHDALPLHKPSGTGLKAPERVAPTPTKRVTVQPEAPVYPSTRPAPTNSATFTPTLTPTLVPTSPSPIPTPTPTPTPTPSTTFSASETTVGPGLAVGPSGSAQP